MKVKYFYLILPIFVIGILFFAVLAIHAQTTSTISYPVLELGNCQSEDVCKTYCDDPANIDVCVSFAKNHNLISEEEAQIAKEFSKGEKGPGGCTSKDLCESYCNDNAHINECLSFAEQHHLMSLRELDDAKKVAQALAEGASTPGNCNGKDQCEIYCKIPAHTDECLNFAEKAGLISSEDLAQARKIAPFMEKGEMPGNCTGKEECQSYCGEDSHAEECAAFFEKAGMMTPEDAQMYRKTGGKGPGNCTSKDACEAFCKDPANQETCFQFSKDHGLISQEDLQKTKQGKQQMQQSLQSAPPEVISCLQDKLGVDTVEKLKNGTGMPTKETGDAMQSCFEENQRQQEERQMMQPVQQQPQNNEGEQQQTPTNQGSQEPHSQTEQGATGGSILNAFESLLRF